MSFILNKEIFFKLMKSSIVNIFTIMEKASSSVWALKNIHANATRLNVINVWATDKANDL